MSAFFSELPLVVSYYTKGTPYEEEVKYLKASCDKFKIECHIEGVSDKGTWEENCAIKPYFMKDKMLQFQRPLLWVDADAVFVQPLQFEEFMFKDLALLKYQDETDFRISVNAATVYVNATEGGLLALDLWCGYADSIKKAKEKAPAFMDQVSLYLVFCSNPPLSISLLPLRYCKIFDQSAEGAVIEQRQASRRFKEICKTPVQGEVRELGL